MSRNNFQLSTLHSPLPRGYKQTEVGVIPEDWEVKPLKRISPKQSVGLVINPSTYFDRQGTVPLLVGSNVSENSIDATTSNRITRASNETLSASRLTGGDLVMVRVGEPGVAAVVPPELDGCNCASMMIVRQHPSLDSHWLCCVMNSHHGRQQVEHVQYGTAQKQFNISDAVDFNYPVPSLTEQRAIASVLSDVDALLGALDRLIAKKRALKQAAMQQLLTGQTRLPGFHGEWELKRLGEGITLHSGHHVLAQHCNTQSGGVPYLTGPADFPEGRIRHTKFTTKPSTICSPGDILVTVKGSGSGTIILADVAYCISRQLMAIRVSVWDVRFIYYSLLQNSAQFRAASTGLIPGLSRSDILDPPLPLPPTIPEQSAIADVLSDMDAEIAALEQRREKTRALKQGMMQELLTGRTRLI